MWRWRKSKLKYVAQIRATINFKLIVALICDFYRLDAHSCRPTSSVKALNAQSHTASFAYTRSEVPPPLETIGFPTSG